MSLRNFALIFYLFKKCDTVRVSYLKICYLLSNLVDWPGVGDNFNDKFKGSFFPRAWQKLGSLSGSGHSIIKEIHCPVVAIIVINYEYKKNTFRREKISQLVAVWFVDTKV